MIGLVVAVLFAGTWVLLNRPVEQDPWTQDVSGLTYTPFRDNANPTNGQEPTLAEVRRDLSLMAGLTSQIRTYSTVGANFGVPTMADKMGLRVMAGAWIDVDPSGTSRRSTTWSCSPPTTAASARVTVGNEAIYKNRGQGSPA
ncbi:MAG: beta-(1-3)-glucosyl transferase, partial [Rhodospirillaceae bacterium]|nr:beta-(1-3)-glucosyl transferase [Rhodospirillaceae bacterium]